MRLLDRYIFRQVLFSCIGAVGFFTFVLLAANILKDLLAFLLAGQLTIETALPLMALLVPFVIVYTLPMGILCGILLVLGRMSAESETVAMRASGMSLARISAPIYVLASFGVLLAMAVNLYYMPLARTRQKQQLAAIVRGDPLKMIVPKTFVRDFRNCIVYVHDKQGNELRDVWIWEMDREKRVRRLIRAETGRLELDEENNQMIVTLNRASAELRDSKQPEDFSKPPQTIYWETTSRALSLEWLFGQNSFRRKLDWLTWGELIAEKGKLERPREDLPEPERRKQLSRVRFVMQQKLTTAFTVFSFALIAVPLGIKVSRRETSANLGLALLLALSYYFLTVMVQWLDKVPEVRPDLLLWIPNLIFVGLAVWLHRRAERA